jgi:hypothetical protein
MNRIVGFLLKYTYIRKSHEIPASERRFKNKFVPYDSTCRHCGTPRNWYTMSTCGGQSAACGAICAALPGLSHIQARQILNRIVDSQETRGPNNF